MLNAAGAEGAFDQLSGEVHAGTAMLARREGHANGRAILDRLETATGNGVQLWIEGSAGGTTVDGRNGFASIGASRYGLAGGAEVGGGGTRGGIGFRHATTDIDVDARSSSGDLTLNSAFAYFGHGFGTLRFGVAGSIGWLKADTERNVAYPGFANRLTANEKGQTFTVAGELAFLPALGGFRAGPYAGISYVDTVLDGTTERGGAGALVLGKVEDTTGAASYGLRGTGTLGSVTLLADIGGRTDLDDLGRPRTLRFSGFDPMFAVSPAGYAKTTVNARLEAGFDMGPVRVGVGGRAEVGRDTTSYGGRLSAGFRLQGRE